jgi:hypothetical protein
MLAARTASLDRPDICLADQFVLELAVDAKLGAEVVGADEENIDPVNGSDLVDALQRLRPELGAAE